MTESRPPEVSGFHAHVYYDAGTKETAARLRAGLERAFDVRVGRWHDRPVGPHPMGSFQIAFAPQQFGEVIPWLALHRDGLVVFIHPETGDAVADHTDYALWMGAVMDLDIEALR